MTSCQKNYIVEKYNLEYVICCGKDYCYTYDVVVVKKPDFYDNDIYKINYFFSTKTLIYTD